MKKLCFFHIHATGRRFNWQDNRHDSSYTCEVTKGLFLHFVIVLFMGQLVDRYIHSLAPPTPLCQLVCLLACFICRHAHSIYSLSHVTWNFLNAIHGKEKKKGTKKERVKESKSKRKTERTRYTDKTEMNGARLDDR